MDEPKNTSPRKAVWLAAGALIAITAIGVIKDQSFSGSENGATEQKIMQAPAADSSPAPATAAFTKKKPSAYEKSRQRPDQVAVDQPLAKGLMSNASEAPQSWSGVDSAIQGNREVVIENATQWAALWNEHYAHRIPVPPLPEIDFKQSQIVGIWTGVKPSSGYTVDIVEIRDEGSRRRVIYHQTIPPLGAIAAAVMTQPYTLRVIARAETNIRFEIQP